MSYQFLFLVLQFTSKSPFLDSSIRFRCKLAQFSIRSPLGSGFLHNLSTSGDILIEWSFMSTNSFSLNSSVHPAHKSPVLKVFSLHLLLLRNHSMLWLKSLVLWITDILPPILRHRSRTSKAPSVSEIGTRPNLFPLHTVSLETVSLFILNGCQPAVSQLTTFPFKSKLRRYFRF